ncbi:MAG: 1-(5-phosphoribosyl)-5-[(5-phosphoribosylamino)methylideneamino]imidazole-4-carboxamide isomerase [Coriobacteriales bacterium]|jgi:phosphoribosylformimino-5-aminoimidazole carboxamide ribotide isomerase|nr:1-(5-phosphoribosyl)-5-[(5-phosphoribosylamino)methylideneamino]imidazole-4-carboxamide isomerase [Coriobacteriales bacterium]
MYLLPAIDLLDGRVVRLARGDYDAVTVYHDDPVEQACRFREEGAEWLHVVDLDGARTGTPSNSPLIEAIIAATGLKVEVGGGVRTSAAIERLVAAGASRVVIGTRLATDPAFAREVAARFGETICAGIDARSGEVAIEGWRRESGIGVTALVEQLASWGIRHLVYTDIARDGMQSGIDAAAYERLARVAGFPVTASGGISTLDDLRALAALGDELVEGVIAGRALYEGSFTVTEALATLSSWQNSHV